MCLQSNNNILKEMININFLMHVPINREGMSCLKNVATRKYLLKRIRIYYPMDAIHYIYLYSFLIV